VNLATIIDPHPAEAVALVSRGKPTTYGDLRAEVAGLRGGLIGLGLDPADRVGIACTNNRSFVLAYLATLGAGAVAVPLNPLSPPRELETELAAIGARVVVAGPSAQPAIDAIDRSRVPALDHVVSSSNAATTGAGVVALADLLAADPVPMAERADDDLAVLMFTSGTAGSPKAAMLSHANLRSNIEQVLADDLIPRNPDDVSLGVLPLFHIFGLNVVLGLTLAVGSSVVLIERFDPGSALDAIARHGVTVIAGAPTMWSAWANLDDADPSAMKTVRIATSGAARLPAEVVDRMRSRFGVTLAEGYGLTEASPVVTSSVGLAGKTGSIGVPLIGVEVRLVDADGSDVLIGDAGEIWVRGPNVFQGYWNDPDATAAAITPDGWLRTGDVAVVDEDGELFIVDRVKDLIIVSGFNVFPAEVEEVLLEHPGVEACAVVGVPHPHSGEAVKAYVVPAEGRSLEEDELIAFAAARLAGYKCPDKVMFVDELPQNISGKILRRALR
jgi:long-chain acyl-CoA synthetase